MAYSKSFGTNVRAAVRFYDEMVAAGENICIQQGGFPEKSSYRMWFVGVDQSWTFDDIDRARSLAAEGHADER